MVKGIEMQGKEREDGGSGAISVMLEQVGKDSGSDPMSPMPQGHSQWNRATTSGRNRKDLKSPGFILRKPSLGFYL